MAPLTNINSWPLWTLTYRCGRSLGTASFFQASEADAIAYAARYVADLAEATGRRSSVVTVSR